MFNLRRGEGRLVLALGGFLFLTVAAETLLSSARNGLFLSIFPPRLVPHVMIGAALVGAAASVAFSGIIEKMARRSIATGLMAILGSVLLASIFAFRHDPRSAFVIYLLVQTVEILALTHAWDYMGDLVTGRQAKRLLPLVGMGASVAAVAGGLSVGPLAEFFTTEGLLGLAALLLFGSLVLLWSVPEPAAALDEDPDLVSGDAVRSFARRAGRGFRSLRTHPLLRLVTTATLLLVLMSTLVDFQWKVAVQNRFTGADIARVFGYMEAAIGVGALLLQLLASRVLFPRLGVSGANLVQAGAVALLAAVMAVTGTFLAVVALRLLDEALGDAVEKPAQQVSLIPFPPRTKNAAFTTLDGVLRPLAQASGALLALFLLSTGPDSIPWIAVGLGGAGLLVLTGHRRRYLAALEEALSRHLVDLEVFQSGRLSVDKGVLDVVDRFLDDDDPTVVVFALSLLRDLPPEKSSRRALPRLSHPVPEVRIEAAGVLGTLRENADEAIHRVLAEHLSDEKDPDVMGAILVAMGSLARSAGEADLSPFIGDSEPAVRRAALTAMAEWYPDAVRRHLETLLFEGESTDREVALSLVGTLGYENFLPVVADAVMEDGLRTAALGALSAFGPAALPTLDHLLGRKELPVPVRRTLITTLASVDDPEARQMLLRLVEHDELGAAALTSLRRLRAAGAMPPSEPGTLRHLLRAEVERSARYALVSAGLERTDLAGHAIFVTKGMEELRIRHLHRALAVLSLAYDTEGIAKAESAIFSDDAARRSNAFEYLDGVLATEDAALAVPLAEWRRGEPLEPLERLTLQARRALTAPLEVLDEDQRWWPRALSRYAAGLTEGEDDSMIPLIEKVMLLKGSELFRGFPGDELAGIAELATEKHAESGDVIFHQGDPGDAYYLVVRGAVSIVRDGQEIAVLETREGFGEMAILDQGTRSATARAVQPTTLLVLDRNPFDQLVEQNPAIARGIYRVLSRRLRSTLARVGAGH